MRNKKYRSWGLVLVLLAFSIFFFLLLFLATTREDKILLTVCGSGIFLVMLLILPLYVEIKDDRIVASCGIGSPNKKYRSSFKKRVFMLDDMSDISVEGGKLIWIHFKDGNSVSIPLVGILQKTKLTGLVYEVRAQVKGYKQNIQ